jgi:hypothetical protein
MRSRNSGWPAVPTFVVGAAFGATAPAHDDVRVAHAAHAALAALAALAARGLRFTHAPHMIHRHEDGQEEWMAVFGAGPPPSLKESPGRNKSLVEARGRQPFALADQLHINVVTRHAQGKYDLGGVVLLH